MISSNIVFAGGGKTIDGASLYRVFFVQSGTVSISDLTIANARAAGGNGGAATPNNDGGGGGGGATASGASGGATGGATGSATHSGVIGQTGGPFGVTNTGAGTLTPGADPADHQAVALADGTQCSCAGA